MSNKINDELLERAYEVLENGTGFAVTMVQRLIELNDLEGLAWVLTHLEDPEDIDLEKLDMNLAHVIKRDTQALNSLSEDVEPLTIEEKLEVFDEMANQDSEEARGK